MGGLAGCASVQTQLPEISIPSLSSERLTQEMRAFRNVDKLSKRLLTVAAPIMASNTELCPKTRLDIGATTHSLKSYSKRLRSAAKRQLGATDDFSILQVVSGSSADKAGLKRGDILLSPTEKPMNVRGKVFQNVLESRDDLRIQRGEDTFTVKVDPVEICNYPIKLSPASTINAYASGRSITMTTGMMNFVKDDNELALIIGHELAHNTMGHIRKTITNFILSAGGTRYTRPFESESDYVGMYYSARAGYETEAVEEFWRRLSLISPKSVLRAKTHPTTPNRYLTLAATHDEIQAKRDAGQPLLPNFVTQ